MLNLKNVKKTYPEANGRRLAILDIPQFSLGEGELMALMGRSGCGKSTLLHVIAGISRPDSGEVNVDGVNIARLSEPAADRFRAERIGYVFQTFNLLAGFTALENVVLGMSFSGGTSDWQRARDLLGRVGLADRSTHRPASLSVGEQQRVAVARALANRPRVLLADEPTANVDPANQEHVVDLIRTTCAEENIALLMVTHAPEVAEQFERVDRLEEVNHVLQQTSSD